MTLSLTKRQAPSVAVVAAYNAVPSVLWSALAFGPLVGYCYRYVERPWLWGFVAVSLSAYAWPPAWLRRLQLSTSVAAYRRLGVPSVGRLAQQGALVNRLLRRRYPHCRVLAGSRAVGKLRSTTYQQERFHWVALVGFLLVSLLAGAKGHWGWALGLSVANVGYNLYPIWLQQYLRVRLGGALFCPARCPPPTKCSSGAGLRPEPLRAVYPAGTLAGCVVSAHPRYRVRTDLLNTPLVWFAHEVAAGRQSALLDRTFALAEVAEAHRYMERNAATGKVVVVIGES